MALLASPWRLSERIGFRFLFLLLGSLSIFCWDNILEFAFRWNFDSEYSFLERPFYWLDRHFFHVGYDPAIYSALPGDSRFGVIFYLLLLIGSIIGTVVWSMLDKKRLSYDKCLYWFRRYLRYVLALTLFTYGIDKVIPSQMSYPGVLDQLRPMGDNNRFSILWYFMGVAPGYMILTGAMEIIGSLLLLYRRTVAAGCLILLVMLVNIVALNIFYNVQVKLFSFQLLCYCLFILYPYITPLVKLFFLGQPVSLVQPIYRLRTLRQDRLLSGVSMLIILVGAGLFTTEVYKRYQRHQAAARSEKIYEVTTFVAKDTLPPLETDTLRWKRCVFTSQRYPPFRDMVFVYYMQGDMDYYVYARDSSRHTLTFKDDSDSLRWPIFHYSYPGKETMLLTGKWKGQDVTISMNRRTTDSMNLNRERITLMHY
jgi:hypothetical protein